MKEARGDRMCQDALQELKMAIKASGEHKQKVNIQIAVDGLKIRDEKTGVSRVGDCNVLTRFLSPGLSLPPPGTQDQLHRPGHDGQQSLRLRVRLSGEWSQVLRDQDGEGCWASGGGHERLVPSGL